MQLLCLCHILTLASFSEPWYTKGITVVDLAGWPSLLLCCLLFVQPFQFGYMLPYIPNVMYVVLNCVLGAISVVLSRCHKPRVHCWNGKYSTATKSTSRFYGNCQQRFPLKRGLEEQVSIASGRTVTFTELFRLTCSYLYMLTIATGVMQDVRNYLLCPLSVDGDKLLCDVRKRCKLFKEAFHSLSG